jgi:DMSO/TMAO reductase YedYZ molybdopterin-dependent catalytic subunit
MADERNEPLTSKLTRTRERWAREGRFLTGKISRPENERLPPGSPGYWEVRGYHNRGDPWTEQRYSAD